MSERCSKKVFDGVWRTRPCSRKAVKDGFCKQHHPDSVAKRRAKSEAQHEENLKKTPWYRLRQAQKQIEELKAEARVFRPAVARCAELEEAIRLHRDSFTDPHDSAEEDRQLWAILEGE